MAIKKKAKKAVKKVKKIETPVVKKPIKKKVKSTEEVKVEEVAKVDPVPMNIQNKQMTTEEMAKMEVYFAEMQASKAEMHTQEQYKKNLLLEKQLLELKIEILNNDIAKENTFINQKQERYDSINNNMITYIEKLKTRYGVKGPGAIKYDRMSGKIIG